MNVTVANQGDYPETLNLTVYASIFVVSQNITVPVSSQNITLSSENFTAIFFVWNTTGYPYGNHTLTASAWPVQNETNSANNNCTGGNIFVTIPGDINGDSKVNLVDLVYLANAYGTTAASGGIPGAAHAWNPNADIDGNGTIGLTDLVILALHYGQHYP